jgi:hypothetical protein
MKKVPVTSVAIIVAPLGSACIIGAATSEYSSFMPGQAISAKVATSTATTAFTSRSRNSIRCEMKVSWGYQWT